MVRRLVVLALIVVGVLFGTASTAAAHNSLESSVPADGTTVTASPGTMQLRFVKDVPLETLTVTLTDPSGVRTKLVGSANGTSAKDVVTPLPLLADGAYTIRWRLVGDDGHAITGRIEFAVAAGVAPTTVAPGDVAGSPATTTTMALFGEYHCS